MTGVRFPVLLISLHLQSTVTVNQHRKISSERVNADSLISMLSWSSLISWMEFSSCRELRKNVFGRSFGFPDLERELCFFFERFRMVNIPISSRIKSAMAKIRFLILALHIYIYASKWMTSSLRFNERISFSELLRNLSVFIQVLYKSICNVLAPTKCTLPQVFILPPLAFRIFTSHRSYSSTSGVVHLAPIQLPSHSSRPTSTA